MDISIFVIKVKPFFSSTWFQDIDVHTVFVLFFIEIWEKTSHSHLKNNFVTIMRSELLWPFFFLKIRSKYIQLLIFHRCWVGNVYYLFEGFNLCFKYWDGVCSCLNCTFDSCCSSSVVPCNNCLVSLSSFWWVLTYLDLEILNCPWKTRDSDFVW